MACNPWNKSWSAADIERIVGGVCKGSEPWANRKIHRSTVKAVLYEDELVGSKTKPGGKKQRKKINNNKVSKI